MLHAQKLALRVAATTLRGVPAANRVVVATSSFHSGRIALYENDEGMKKAHESAISDFYTPEPNSEGHSLDNAKNARRYHDAHTEQLDISQNQAKGTEGNKISPDAINLAAGRTGGFAEKSRQMWKTSEGSEYQPGQEGEQVGSTGQGEQEGEGIVGQGDAPSNRTWSALGQVAKNVIGSGPASKGFHSYAAARAEHAVPDEAVEKGARKPKDTSVGGEQTPHLKHHAEGKEDEMPAVKDNAALPSKKGAPSGNEGTDVSSRGKKGANLGKGPSQEERPTGTADTPGSRAVDFDKAIHNPSFEDGPSATYTHVVGSPEPDSYKTQYQYADGSEAGVITGKGARSSSSTDTYNEALTANLPKNEAGIGSSNHMIRNPLKGADEMVAKMDSAGTKGEVKNPAGRGETVGEVGKLNQPSDVGQVPEDTLPKPLSREEKQRAQS